jgi:hypothetical protein
MLDRQSDVSTTESSMTNAQESGRGAQERSDSGTQDKSIERQPVPGHTENMPVGPDMPQAPGGGAIEDAAPTAGPDTKPGTPPGTQSERDRLRGSS